METRAARLRENPFGVLTGLEGRSCAGLEGPGALVDLGLAEDGAVVYRLLGVLDARDL